MFSSVSAPSSPLRRYGLLLKKTGEAYMDDNILSRGAAVAFYAGTSLAPLLLIIIAIVGLVYGQDAARDAIVQQFSTTLGKNSAELMQSIVVNVSDKQDGHMAVITGTIMLIITASGIFGEIQAGLNAIWHAKPKGSTLSRLVRARMASLGLVAVFGFLLLTSLAASAGISALSSTIKMYLPFGTVILGVIDTCVSFGIFSFLFAAIYKILPDVHLEWHEVGMGAFLTAGLFIIGKSLIGVYIGSSAVTSSYGAASAPIIILLWIYYSSQVFFLGAEFTKIYTTERAERRSPQRL
jgi:membrane protein